MRRRLFIALLLTLTLTLSGLTLRKAAAEAGRTRVEGVPAAEDYRGFGSPFRAIARLFGGGKSKKEGGKEKQPGKAEPEAQSAAESTGELKAGAPVPVKIERTTKEDARQFEFKNVTRVTDSVRTSPTADSLGAGEAEAHLVRGRALLARANYYEASIELSAAVALDPKRGEAFNLLGVALDGRGWHDRAIDHYKQALRLMPDDPQVLNNLGYSFYLSNDFSSAKKYLEKAARRAPRDERILNNLATAQYRLGKKKDALESFVRASDPFTGRMNLAALLSRFGNYRDAAELCEEARRLDPRAAAPLEMLATAYDRMGRAAEAEGARRALAELNLAGVKTAVKGR
jgi:Flp pilus assembly protein TadD